MYDSLSLFIITLHNILCMYVQYKYVSYVCILILIAKDFFEVCTIGGQDKHHDEGSMQCMHAMLPMHVHMSSGAWWLIISAPLVPARGRSGKKEASCNMLSYVCIPT